MLLCAPRVWFTASIFLKGMGKRTFRLGQHEKNEDCVGRCLIVSVPSSRECQCFCYSVSEYLCTANIDSRSTSTATAGFSYFYTVSSDIGMHCTIPRMSCMQSQPFEFFSCCLDYIASKDPSLVLCKFQFHGCGTTINVNRTVIYCVSIDQKLNWSLSLQNRTIHFGVCSMLGLLPTLVNSCAKLKSVLDVLDVAYVCTCAVETQITNFNTVGPCSVPAEMRNPAEH